MAQSKVKKKVFTKLPVTAKIIYSRDRVLDMTGNPNFPTPNPSLATVTTVTNDLETAELAAEGGGPAQTDTRNAAALVWDNTMRALADYVDSIALGNTVIINSAGFTPTDVEGTPHALPAQPGNLKHSPSKVNGEIFFSCDAVPDAESYVAVLSTDAAALGIVTLGTQLMITLNAATPAPLAAPPAPPASGNVLLVVDASKERRKTIRGLESGKRIYAKMYCFNATGRGPDSDVVSIMVG